MGKDGSHGHGHALEGRGYDCLGRAAPEIIRRGDVEPVLRYVEVEVAKVGGAEAQEGLQDAGIVVGFVALFHLLHDLREHPQQVLVQVREVVIGNSVGRCFVVSEVPNHVARRIAELAIALKGLLENGVTDPDVTAVVATGDPETEQVDPVRGLELLVVAALDDLHRADHVTERLAHFVPLLVEHKAVCDDGLVGSLPPGGDAREQGALKPAPVLIAALKVDISRIGKL
mmetsp:Transcript_6510/g.12488  ORF Transcript_6510/g.12488 Transcript_6510/m.12488 type:complete len:229 (-) Transcript_6510:1230-1916(-)